MRLLRNLWRISGEIGAQNVTDNRELKLLRLFNRSAIATALVLAFVAVDFLRAGLNYTAAVNAVAVMAILGCLFLTRWRFFVSARIIFLIVLHATTLHHHFYFGFAAGFWIMHMVLLPGPVMLFPQKRSLGSAGILAGMILAGAGIMLVSREIPALYPGMTVTMIDRFLTMNILRAPIVLAIITFIVFSENNRVETELEKAALAANEMAEAKSFFLSNMSHELRTPMNAIKGFSEILLELNKNLPDDRERGRISEYLTRIRESAVSLTLVIDDILDFARIETNRVVIRSRDFDLLTLCADILETALLSNHRRQRIEVRTELQPGLPQWIRGDDSRLGQILLNLLNNALKFTHEGTVSLRVKVQDQNPTGYLIGFEVADTGIGIPSEKLPHLFESFSQVSRETAVRYGGTGLGLAISKHLVEMLGGKITVMSSPGRGSVFTFSLWFVNPGPAVIAGKSEICDLRGAAILVAEDNEVNQILIKTILEGWNARVEIVDNGLKALGRAQRDAFDLILMDLQMPFMDGIEATDHIRSLDDAARARVPVIALTADVLSDTRRRSLSAGMTDIVTKPVNQAELYAAVCKALSIK